MNVGEATATTRILDFLAGRIDHADAATRAGVAEDVAWLQARARGCLHAGEQATEDEWDDRLCLITFEGE